MNTEELREKLKKRYENSNPSDSSTPRSTSDSPLPLNPDNDGGGGDHVRSATVSETTTNSQEDGAQKQAQSSEATSSAASLSTINCPIQPLDVSIIKARSRLGPTRRPKSTIPPPSDSISTDNQMSNSRSTDHFFQSLTPDDNLMTSPLAATTSSDTTRIESLELNYSSSQQLQQPHQPPSASSLLTNSLAECAASDSIKNQNFAANEEVPKIRERPINPMMAELRNRQLRNSAMVTPVSKPSSSSSSTSPKNPLLSELSNVRLKSTSSPSPQKPTTSEVGSEKEKTTSLAKSKEQHDNDNVTPLSSQAASNEKKSPMPTAAPKPKPENPAILATQVKLRSTGKMQNFSNENTTNEKEEGLNDFRLKLKSTRAVSTYIPSSKNVVSSVDGEEESSAGKFNFRANLKPRVPQVPAAHPLTHDATSPPTFNNDESKTTPVVTLAPAATPTPPRPSCKPKPLLNLKPTTTTKKTTDLTDNANSAAEKGDFSTEKENLTANKSPVSHSQTSQINLSSDTSATAKTPPPSPAAKKPVIARFGGATASEQKESSTRKLSFNSSSKSDEQKKNSDCSQKIENEKVKTVEEKTVPPATSSNKAGAPPNRPSKLPAKRLSQAELNQNAMQLLRRAANQSSDTTKKETTEIAEATSPPPLQPQLQLKKTKTSKDDVQESSSISRKLLTTKSVNIDQQKKTSTKKLEELLRKTSIDDGHARDALFATDSEEDEDDDNENNKKGNPDKNEKTHEKASHHHEDKSSEKAQVSGSNTDKDTENQEKQEKATRE